MGHGDLHPDIHWGMSTYIGAPWIPTKGISQAERMDGFDNEYLDSLLMSMDLLRCLRLLLRRVLKQLCRGCLSLR